MYRLLEKGEITLCDDEYWQADRWHAWGPYHAGNPLVLDCPVRRLVKTDVTPAALPDPGEGYRLLTEGETINSDDDWYHLGKWVPCRCAAGWKKWWSSVLVPHRRRVEKPAPVVSVGDRVKVLSGPWAGCTGVVRYVADDCSVLMDHVYVGGDRLVIVRRLDRVEPLPPVVPEALYRDLSHGETIRIEDEYLFCGSWLAGSTEPRHVGKNLEKYHVRHRRPVRLQSPGWRYLDAGETVQAGDEIQMTKEGIWESVRSSAGTKVGDNHSDGRIYFFRRKLPVNVGG